MGSFPNISLCSSPKQNSLMISKLEKRNNIAFMKKLITSFGLFISGINLIFGIILILFLSIFSFAFFKFIVNSFIVLFILFLAFSYFLSISVPMVSNFFLSFSSTSSIINKLYIFLKRIYIIKICLNKKKDK